ncbi:MAG: patatin-like phospholipase family protein [Deltaproteobacteria bacterium]|nr:patatin-like phospholipase family protein [Deltaproteobacteria bacterium]
MKFGLALSGGGVRAAIFHLGVLARLARDGLLENVSFLSTVSGGSLAVGLIYCKAGYAWPSSDGYLGGIVDTIREQLTSSNVQWSYIRRSVMKPWRLLRGRAHVLGDVLTRKWGIYGDLSDLPSEPRWIINATCYETGKNWRFSQPRMGDYQTQYVLNPPFPLADALAASAAFPGMIGPLKIFSHHFLWQRFGVESQEMEPVQPLLPSYHLWDGGVYDNLGVEALYKPNGGLRDGVDFLVVSDASKPINLALRSWKDFLLGRRFLRIVNIAKDQVQAIRSRMIVSSFQQYPLSGVYLRIGNTGSEIYRKARKTVPLIDQLAADDVSKALNMETTLRCVAKAEFDLLFRHGFEVTDATLCAYQSDRFSAIPFVGAADISRR